MCTLFMLLGGKGWPLVISPPEKIIAKGPYAYVRNPMMWSLIEKQFHTRCLGLFCL